MSGRHSRDKGARFERQIASDLNGLYSWVKARRNLDQYQQSDGRDIVFAGDSPHLCIQCKCGKKISIPKALQEAVGAAKERELPLVVAHWDNGPTVAVLRWDDFLEILMGCLEEGVLF